MEEIGLQGPVRGKHSEIQLGGGATTRAHLRNIKNQTGEDHFGKGPGKERTPTTLGTAVTQMKLKRKRKLGIGLHNHLGDQQGKQTERVASCRFACTAQNRAKEGAKGGGVKVIIWRKNNLELRGGRSTDKG